MDTVVYRLHNIEKYPITIKAIERLKGGRGMLLIEDLPDLKGVTSLRQALFNKDRDSFRLMAYNAKLYLPSSSSGINIRYDESQKFIEFNLSLPKFFFGNNVCELIPPIQHKRYNRSAVGMQELCLQYWWNALKWAFKKIVNDLTGGLETVKYWGDVQLFRWDIAFNQIFNSKDDAMHYLDSVGRVSAPRIVDGNKMKYDNGNVTFKTDNYYFKCYHKGTDFANTGAAQVRKIFQELGGKVVFNTTVTRHPILGTFSEKHEVIQRGNLLREGSNIELSLHQLDNLQAYADKILRYEFEATGKFFSYVYNTRLAKIKIPAYRYLQRVCAYICRDENLLWANHIDVRYRAEDGTMYRRKEKLMLYETEYWLPESLVEKDGTRDKYVKVEHPQSLKRIEKLLRAYRILDVKFLLKNTDAIKKVHKYLESEKSKEHRFFFDEPMERIYPDVESMDYYERPVKNAQYAVHSSEIPLGVHYDGPIMEILESVPKDQRITKQLLQLAIMKHNQLFEVLQFEKLPEVKQIELLVKEYNKQLDSIPRLKGKKKEAKMNVRQMKLLFRAFKHDTWDDIRRGGDVSRKTLYNWKKKCEKLFGFTKQINFISDIDLTNVPRAAPTLYSRHYDDLLIGDNPLSLFLQNTKQLLLF